MLKTSWPKKIASFIARENFRKGNTGIFQLLSQKQIQVNLLIEKREGKIAVGRKIGCVRCLINF